MKLATILKRVKEPSTWAGLAALGLILGADPVKVDALQQAGVAVAGLVAIFLPESKPAQQEGA